MDLGHGGAGVGVEAHGFAAEGFVYLCDLVGVVVDVAHYVFVELHVLGCSAHFDLDASAFAGVQTNEELSEDVDAGEDVAVVALCYVLFVGSFETVGFDAHFLEEASLQVLLPQVSLYAEVLLIEDRLDGQQDHHQQAVLLNTSTAAHQQDLAQFRVQRQEGQHLAQLSDPRLLH